MRTPKGYTTIEQIEDYLLIMIDPAFGAQVSDWIAKIEEYIERFTSRIFIVPGSDSSNLYDGDNTDTLLIDDAMSITSVEIGSDDDGWTDVTDDCYFYPANKTPKTRIVYDGKFTRGNQNIKVTGKFAYSTAVPGDLEFAITVIVAGMINKSQDKTGVVQSMTIGRYSVSYDNTKGWDDFKQAQETLSSYRKIKII